MIGILRKCPLRHAVAFSGVFYDAGLTVLEVTLDSERPLDQVKAICEAFPAMEVGVGSVLDAQSVPGAVDAGAAFIVSPIVDPGVISAATERGVASIPGAATPTEIAAAISYGATAVKVFPIDQLGGPSFIRAIMSPLGSPRLIPTGGVSVESIPAYLEAGAAAVGLGGTLFPGSALRDGDVTAVAGLAREVARVLP